MPNIPCYKVPTDAPGSLGLGLGGSLGLPPLGARPEVLVFLAEGLGNKGISWGNLEAVMDCWSFGEIDFLDVEMRCGCDSLGHLYLQTPSFLPDVEIDSISLLAGAASVWSKRGEGGWIMSDSETHRDSETTIPKLRFRNYLPRFRNKVVGNKF